MYIGIDVGGTKTALVVTANDLTVISTLSWPTPLTGIDGLLGSIVDSVTQVVASSAAGDVVAIGIGVPGLVSTEDGRVLLAPNLPALNCQDIGSLLKDALQASGVELAGVCVGNDADLAVLAEATSGAAAGGTVVVGLTVGTGVGGGIVIDGRPFTGAHGGAGEFGHMTLQADGPECVCGNRGCLEVLASGDSVVTHMRNIINGLDKGHSHDPADFDTAVKVGRAAQGGDEYAIRSYQVMGRWLGVGIANLANIFAPDHIVVGGGVTVRVGDFFIPAAFAEARARMLPDLRERVSLVTASLGNFAGAVGAAGLAVVRYRA